MRALTMLIAILSALTVVVAMRIVGSLLVSALMVVPVAIAQLGAHSFRRTMAYAMVLGAFLCLALTYYIDLSPGATIVVAAIALYAVGYGIRGLRDHFRRKQRMRELSAPAEHPEASPSYRADTTTARG